MSLVHSVARHLILIGALATPGLQADVKFSGSTGYEIIKDGTAVSISADAIENGSRENATGTLMVKLWALESPHDGGALNGFLLGSFKLDGLAPGKRYASLKKVVNLTAPAVRKYYFICLTVSEFRGGAYGITDFRNMPKPKMLGPLKPFVLEGPWQWQTSYEGGTLDISVAKVSHHRTGKTGSLRLAVWATKEPYTGGTVHGFELGFVDKKALDPGYSYTGLHHVAKFKAPPDGNYYVGLVLSEFDGKQYVIVDHLATTKPSTFSGPRK